VLEQERNLLTNVDLCLRQILPVLFDDKYFVELIETVIMCICRLPLIKSWSG